MSATIGDSFGGVAENLDAIQQARLSAETLWQAASAKDIGSGLEFHPLVVGLMFELPFEADGPASWAQAERDQWFALADMVLSCVYKVNDPSPPDTHELDDLRVALDTSRAIERALNNRIRALEEERDELKKARATAGTSAAPNPTNGHSPVSATELRSRLIQLAHDHGQDANKIIGYELTAASVVRNSEARGWSEGELAAITGVHQNAISRMVEGEDVQTWQSARVAAAFRLTEDQEENG